MRFTKGSIVKIRKEVSGSESKLRLAAGTRGVVLNDTSEDDEGDTCYLVEWQLPGLPQDRCLDEYLQEIPALELLAGQAE